MTKGRCSRPFVISAPAGAPNLLERPPLGPFARERVIRVIRRVLVGEEFDEVEKFEAVRAQETHPISVAQLELDTLVRSLPFQPMQSALRALQRLGGRPFFGRAQNCECRVAQEHELATWSQQAGRLGYPFVRIAPDRCTVKRDSEVE